MREKKIRGMKRKTNTMIKRIEEHTKTFPSTFYNDEYWYMPLPVSQAFIESHKTPRKVKRLCIQTLIDRVNHLIKIKPSDAHTYRVVTIISIEIYGDRKLSYLQTMTTFKIFSIEIMNLKNGSLFQMKLIFGKHVEFQFALLPNCCTFKKSFMMKMQSIKKRFGLLESYLKRGTFK